MQESMLLGKTTRAERPEEGVDVREEDDWSVPLDKK